MRDKRRSDAIASGADARAVLSPSRRLRELADDALQAAEKRRGKARKAYESARDEVVKRQLAEMPIARLRETTQGGVRFAAIEAAGIRTVADVARTSPQRLTQIRGVGAHSAMQVIGAARQLELAMKEGLWLRFEADVRPEGQGKLLKALAAYEVASAAIGPLREDLERLTAVLSKLEKQAGRTSSRLKMFFSGRAAREDARSALEELDQLLDSAATEELGKRAALALARVEAKSKAKATDAIWADYEKRAAAFNGLLVEVAELSPEEAAAEGHLPAELAARVHEHPLDTSLLTVSLRGYQAFGAKFALEQRKAMLGDEMGLGKTIEALAAICHLAAQGSSHFMVICPASVLVNWLHEIDRHSDLAGVRLHGADRSTNFKTWSRRGGVAVTTFQTLRWLYEQDFDVAPAMLVIDEAHYIKNPRAQRTRAAVDFMEYAERTLFLTGTPMENRVDEFRTLIQHLQPAVAAKVNAVEGLAGAKRFRASVAPVYLRRNQADVLQELPPRIETEEWVVFAGDDLEAYREAVIEGNFMAMRQAAYLPATRSGSGKLSRMADIVEEAMSNNRKVVVFSYFRGVLETVASLLDDVAMGPLNGSMPPTKRQKLVDDFSAASSPRALVSQIEAGGVGLNIQAASVVILAEPQWKPSSEEQAIARCHRMGQARPVDVHRLFAEDSVDQRMLEILAAKSSLFEEYVRKSDLKDVSPDAVDVSDLATTRDVVNVAEAERRIVEIERRRMGVEVVSAVPE